MVLVNAATGFTEDLSLWQWLQAEFGSGIRVISRLLPSFNRAGTLVALMIVTPDDGLQMVVYNKDTFEITAMCDPVGGASISAALLWSPDDQFPAYWYGEGTTVFSMTDGRVYVLPAGPSHISWINEDVISETTP